MQVKKRTRLEIVDTEKRYYSNFDQTENGICFWKLFVIVLIILTLIILFLMCCRYIGQIVCIFKRCLVRRNGKCNDDYSPIIKGTNATSYSKQRFSWPAACDFSKFHANRNGQRNKQCQNKCKLKTLLQEKKKLLAPNEHKNVTTNNGELKKRLSLKMRFSPACIVKSVSNKSDTKDCESHECDESGAQTKNNFYRSSYENDRDICFSDSDLKFLVVPLYPKRSRAIKDELLLCKWDTGNIVNHSKRRDNTSSKLIELTFENAESFSDTTQRYGIPKSNCIPYSPLPKDSVTNSKCFSDTAVKRTDTVRNVFLNKLRRSTNSYTTCMLPSMSNANEKQKDQIVIDSKIGDSCEQPVDNVNGMITDELAEVKLKLDLLQNDLHSKNVHQKMISDVVRNKIKEINNYAEKSNSDVNLINHSLHNFIVELSFVPTTGICNNESTFAPSDCKSETNDVYDELGILFSHYVKLQTQPCERKYCPLKRYLKRQMRHSTQKCQRRFSYYQMYPYDQRPTCNSGNVCEDTYDELKLMYTPPAERKHVYHYMFQRRKHFLNQPYKNSALQNSTATEQKIKQ